MPGLILKLRAHEQILVNGVVMQNGDRNARLIIKTPDAKILRLRDAIHPEEANTPVRRVCYIAQLGVAGETDIDETTAQLQKGISQLREALCGFVGVEILDDALNAVNDGNFYGALKYLRRLIPIEDELMSGVLNPQYRAAE